MGGAALRATRTTALVAGLCAASTARAETDAEVLGFVPPPEQIFGTLDPADEVYQPRGTRADRVTFQGRAGWELVAELASESFDGFLVVLDASGTPIAENDDTVRASRDARVVIPLTADAPYTIVVTSWRGGLGVYELRTSIRRVPTLETHPIAPGAQVVDALDLEDAVTVEGALADALTFDVQAGECRELIAGGEGFEPRLRLLSPVGELVAESALSNAPIAQLQYCAPLAGRYRALVSTYDGRAWGGAYRAVLLESPSSEPAAELHNGVPVDATLAGTGVGGQMWRIRLERGDELAARVETQAFDPAIRIYGPRGEALADDDDAGGGWQSVARVIAPESGEYRVRVHAALDSAAEYRLVASAGQPAYAPTQRLMDDRVEGTLASGDLLSLDGRRLVDSWAFSAGAGQRMVFWADAEQAVDVLVVGPTGEPVPPRWVAGRFVFELDRSGSYAVSLHSDRVESLPYVFHNATRVFDPGEAVRLEPAVAAAVAPSTAASDRLRVFSWYAAGSGPFNLRLTGAPATTTVWHFDAAERELLPSRANSEQGIVYRILATEGLNYVVLDGAALSDPAALVLEPVRGEPGVIVPVEVGANIAASTSSDDLWSASLGAFADLYSIWLAPGERIELTAESDTCDARYAVVDEFGATLLRVDDGINTLNAVSTFTAPREGQYLIAATCVDLSGESAARYALRIGRR